MNIKNSDDLFLSPQLTNDKLNLRKIGLEALEIAIEAVRPKKLINDAIKIEGVKLSIKNDIYDLSQFKNIYIIGGGKATAEMANSIANILNKVPNIEFEGIINIPEGLNIDTFNFKNKFQINFASHPIPNLNGLNGTKHMIELLKEAKQNDLIICLISGGGSALMPLPRNNITLLEKQDLNSLLLACGASIHEINTIRKHISDFKGGNLAKTVYNQSKATLISLIISDVIGNNLDSIASGPTVPDSTTFKDAIDILKKYHIYNNISPRIKLLLKDGLINPQLENPKLGDRCFEKVHNYLLGSIENAINEVLKFLEFNKYQVEVFSNNIKGEARDFGKELLRIIISKLKKKYLKRNKNKIALLGSGELTVTIKGNGIGGRNEEMLLSFLKLLNKKVIKPNFLIIAANLDGFEGNSLAMGAFIDNQVLNQVKLKNLVINDYFNDYLENNDSNSFFKEIGTEIITGFTGCNVNDIIIILIQC